MDFGINHSMSFRNHKRMVNDKTNGKRRKPYIFAVLFPVIRTNHFYREIIKGRFLEN